MNNYSTLDPEQMTSSELRGIIADLTTAKNWGAANAQVTVGENKALNTVGVRMLQTYREALNTESGGIPNNTPKEVLTDDTEQSLVRTPDFLEDDTVQMPKDEGGDEYGIEPRIPIEFPDETEEGMTIKGTNEEE